MTESRYENESSGTSGDRSSGASGTTPTGTPPKRTPEEQAVLDLVAKSRGKAFAERYAHLILEQARAIGHIE